MKTENENRLQTIESIILLSTELKINLIDYRVVEDHVYIWSIGDYETYHATDLIINLSIFCTYLKYNEKAKKIELVVY